MAHAAKQDTPRRLQHFRKGTEAVPGQVTAEGTDLAHRYTGVLGVTPIEGAAHATHHGGNRLALHKLATGRRGNGADRFNAENARKSDIWRMALSSEQLGTVDPEGLDPYQHLAWAWHWNEPVFDLQRLWPAGRMEHNRLHGPGQWHAWIPLHSIQTIERRAERRSRSTGCGSWPTPCARSSVTSVPSCSSFAWAACARATGITASDTPCNR